MCFEFGIYKYFFKTLNHSTCLAVFRKMCIFAGGKTLKGEKTMAKPIEATPVLEGADAVAFIAEMEKNEKASKEEKIRVQADANSFRAMFHYDLTQLL